MQRRILWLVALQLADHHRGGGSVAIRVSYLGVLIITRRIQVFENFNSADV